ncbi:RNA polymerase sigma factor [Streptomyces sp. NPDC048512]
MPRPSNGSPQASCHWSATAAESDLDVDDIVQDTMVAVIRALPDLRDTAKLRSWLVAIAVRRWTPPGRASRRTQRRPRELRNCSQG